VVIVAMDTAEKRKSVDSRRIANDAETSYACSTCAEKHARAQIDETERVVEHVSFTLKTYDSIESILIVHGS
jgi:hypothetical protein